MSEDKKYGKWFICEGTDGVGKSTVSHLIADWLNSMGIATLYTRHPGSTNIGAELRKVIKESTAKIDARTEALIMAADNSAFLTQILEPALERGDWVIADRNNFISSLAYQTASGCALGDLDAVHAATHSNPPKADILFIFTASREILDQRKSTRGLAKRDNFEDRGNDYTARVMEAYNSLKDSPRLLKFIKSDGFVPNVKIIDASKPLHEVVEAVKSEMMLSINGVKF